MPSNRNVVRLARWLAFLAMLANAALPVLAHAHALQRDGTAGRLQVCAGGELRWVRADAGLRVAGRADPGPAERSTSADRAACPVCAAFAGADALSASPDAPPAVVDRGTCTVPERDAVAIDRGRWLVAPARAPPILLAS
jgi:hypothetical protein